MHAVVGGQPITKELNRRDDKEIAIHGVQKARFRTQKKKKERDNGEDDQSIISSAMTWSARQIASSNESCDSDSHLDGGSGRSQPVRTRTRKISTYEVRSTSSSCKCRIGFKNRRMLKWLLARGF